MEELNRWNNLSQDQIRLSLQEYAADPDKQAFDYIDLVRNKHGVYASTGGRFHYAIFGRDSLEVGEDLLDTHKELAKTIILELAEKQGITVDPITEEEPGKIHHEYRASVFEGKPIPQESVDIMGMLQDSWGGVDTDEMLYYGSYDSTPLFIRFVARFVGHYGKDILDETYTDRKGETQTVRDATREAAHWLMKKINSSQSDLFEYKRMSDKGLINQVWKDSYNSYLFSDGELANAAHGIASVELQGYAYDALMGAANIIDSTDTVKIQELIAAAKRLQQATLKKLWMPEVQYFAQGIDRDALGNERQIDSITSNGGLLLDSNLLKDLPEDVSKPFVEGIVRKINSEEFMTPAGLRCRALSHADIQHGVGYHSSYAVWPKESHDIAEGLRNHGYYEYANAIGQTVVNAVISSGGFYELFYVDKDNNVMYDYEEILSKLSARIKSEGGELPVPEVEQAWTISAFISEVLHLHNKHAPVYTNTNNPTTSAAAQTLPTGKEVEMLSSQD